MAEKPSINSCKLVELPKILNRNGNITPIHGNQDIPFEIKRVFYIYDIPGGESRGGHAHRKLQQLIICAIGSFDVSIDDGINRDIVPLNRAYRGLYVPPHIWASEINFSSGAICLVLASDGYKEDDYIRKYEDYLKYIESL